MDMRSVEAGRSLGALIGTTHDGGVVPTCGRSYFMCYGTTMIATTIPSIVTSVRLRAKNQLTLPDGVARAVDAHPGDRFRIWVEQDGTIQLRRAPASLAGAFPGMWGRTSEEVAAHIDELRDEWERDEQP